MSKGRNDSRSRKLAIYWVFILTVIAISKCSGPGNVGKEAEVTFPVQVMKVKKGEIEKTTDYFGDIKGLKEIRIFSPLSSKLLKINKDVGDFVKKGDTLGIVDNERIYQMVRQAEASYASARAQYQNIKTEYERIKNLYQNNAVSRSQYDQIKAQMETAEAGVKQAEANLKTVKKQFYDSYLITPINGIVSNRMYDVGDMCTPQMPIFTVVDMDTVKIEVQVPDNEISMIKKGQQAIITVDAYPDTEFIGTVYNVYPTINPATRTTTVEIRFRNKDYLLKPGMFARIKIIVQKKNDAIVIPRKAVLEKTELDVSSGEITTSKVRTKRYVYVVNGNLAYKREIETGIENDYFIEVVKGLRENDSLVTVGQQFLSDSAKVEIIR